VAIRISTRGAGQLKCSGELVNYRGLNFDRRSGVVAILTSICLVMVGCCGIARAEEGAGRVTTIVVFGDSQAQGIAGGLQHDLIGDRRFKILNRTHAGAALVHGETDWMSPIRNFLAQEKADIAVVMFGANDRLDIKDADSGKYVHFKSEAWRNEYVRRTDMILAALADSGLKVVWCGNPIARSDTYSTDMNYINQVFAERAERLGARFLPLWEATADEAGKYVAYGKDHSGVTRRLRADDGIHFTSAGYELIAYKIIDLFPLTAADGQ
jgi:uncharacterized protein